MVRNIINTIENGLALFGLTVLTIVTLLILCGYFQDHCSTWFHKTICIFS